MPRTSNRGARQRSAPDWVHQFLVVLINTEPLVWRRIQVPEHYSFWDLHVAIQDAMGWLDCHFHEFKVIVDVKPARIERFGIPGDEFIDERPCRPDWTVRVSDYVNEGGVPVLYVYDFGDDWRHAVMYEGAAQMEPSATYPLCLSGARRCPPEDCGGVHGYAAFLAAVRDPHHPEHAELLRWGGRFDPDDFDPTKITFHDPQKRWKGAFERSST